MTGINEVAKQIHDNADVAPVVHCRDCKHARKSKEVFEFDAVTPLCECSYMKLPHRWYEYCSWGERRESE